MARHETSPVDLHDLLAKVDDEASFATFAKALADDFAASTRFEREAPSGPYGPAALGWENTSVDSFLDAASAWARESTAEMRAQSPNPWHRCAAILLMGKLYE